MFESRQARQKNMRIGIKILIVVLVILVLLFSAVYIYFATKGKTLLIEKLEQGLKREIHIGQQALKMPLVLEMKDLKIGELGKVDYVSVSVSLSGLLGGKIVLNNVKIVRPEINWVRKPPGTAAIKQDSFGVKEPEKKILGQPQSQANAAPQSQANAAPQSQANAAGKQRSPIMIKHLSVEDGIINFIDQAVSETGIQVTLKEVSLDMDNLYLFSKVPMITNFHLTARMPWREGSSEGTFYTSGWVNLFKKDMQARLELEGIDSVYLHPYYSQWMDLEDARIKEARLNLFSDIEGENNEVVAHCRLELTDLKFKSRPTDEPEHEAEKIATVLLGIFRALNQGKIVLNFTIRTKMYNPEFDFSGIGQAMDNTINEAIESGKVKVTDGILPPGGVVKDVTKGTTGAAQAIIESTLSIGRSILDILKTGQESEDTQTQQE